MKIVQINTTYGDADSTGRNVKELHHYFSQNDIASYVFVNRLNDMSSSREDNVFLFSNNIDEKIHALMSRISGLQGYYSRLSTRKLLAELEKINPDVVVLNVLHSNCVNFDMLFGYLSGKNIAVFIVLHDCFFFTGHCCHYIDVGCDRWMKNCGACPSLKKWNKSLFFDRTERCLKDKEKWFNSISKLNIIAVSRWMEREAKKSILKNARITTIYNWVDMNIFKYTDEMPKLMPKIENRKIAVAVASYWDEDKGLSDIQKLAREMPELAIILIGRTERESKEKNIYNVGVIRDVREMVRYYSIADVFINPSKQETFGKTTAEALACGTPVVAYKTTACNELVDNSRGALAELGNLEDFILKVTSVLKNQKVSYFDNAVKFARENFDGGANMGKYLSFILSTVDGMRL